MLLHSDLLAMGPFSQRVWLTLQLLRGRAMTWDGTPLTLT